MKTRIYFLLISFVNGSIFFSCNSQIKKGDEISESELAYLKEIGILDDKEKILLFDSQLDFKSSGNFFSDKRIASYWIDKGDESKTSIDFALYSDIDTILTKDLTRSITYASYLEVTKNDGKKLKVYVDGDSSDVWNFFDKAILEWKKQNAGKF